VEQAKRRRRAYETHIKSVTEFSESWGAEINRGGVRRLSAAANVIIVYIYFPTGAGELSVPAIWPRGEQPQGYLTSPGKPLCTLPTEGAGGSRTFTYRSACCLTK
jgi:hypothetical protein